MNIYGGIIRPEDKSPFKADVHIMKRYSKTILMLPNMLDLRFYTAEVSDVHMNLVTV